MSNIAIVPADDDEPKPMLQSLSFEGLYKVAESFSKTEMIPSHFRGKPDSIMAAWAFGTELGLGHMQSLTSICVINGNPALWGDAVPGIASAQQGFVRFDVEDNFDTSSLNDWKCTVYLVRRDIRGDEDRVKGEFSYADAKAAGLTGKDNWKKYPKRMVFIRARTLACRNAYPGALKGLPVAEEIQDADYDVTDTSPIEPDDTEPTSGTERLKVQVAREPVKAQETTAKPPTEIKLPPLKDAAVNFSPTPPDRAEQGDIWFNAEKDLVYRRVGDDWALSDKATRIHTHKAVSQMVMAEGLEQTIGSEVLLKSCAERAGLEKTPKRWGEVPLPTLCSVYSDLIRGEF